MVNPLRKGKQTIHETKDAFEIDYSTKLPLSHIEITACPICNEPVEANRTDGLGGNLAGWCAKCKIGVEAQEE